MECSTVGKAGRRSTMTTKATMLRLQREIVELEKEPLEGIRYHFLDNDMKRMCLILTPQSGPFRGLRLHLQVHIPDDYPLAPPRVTIQTIVDHPNVLGRFICCDILKPRSKWQTKSMGYNGGYTPAYLLKYIFYQLLSFFSVDEVEQDYGGLQRVVSCGELEVDFWRRARDKVLGYECGACGFNISVPSTIDDMDVYSMAARQPEVAGTSDDEECSLDKLDLNCWLSILDHLSDQDMHSLSRAWPPVKELQQNVLIRRQLVCFYLRKSHTESVLGIGLQVEENSRSFSAAGRSGRGRPHLGRWVGRPASIRMLDVVSHEAYSEHGVRTGIYGEDFNVFLPIAIDASHFRRAQTILKDSLMNIHRSWVRPEKVCGWPLCIVDVLPRLMNRMVLELVKDCDTQLQNRGPESSYSRGLSGSQRRTVKRSSEKALQGYCLLLDLFEKLVKRFPEVEREIRRRVRLFRESDLGRHKSCTPDLGEFLTYLLVLKEEWGTYCVSFVAELLARNVVWYLDGRNGNTSLVHLAYLEDDTYVSMQRLEETFTASSPALKLFMFQVSIWRLVSKGINSHYGYPSAQDSSMLFERTQEIYRVKDWNKCFHICEYPPPVEHWQIFVCKMLKRAVRDSQTAKYHVMPYSQHQLYYWRSVAEPRCPSPRWFDKHQDPNKHHLRKFPPAGLSFFPSNP